MDYQDWIETFDTLSDDDRLLIRRHVAAMPRRPFISIVMPVYNTPERLLTEAIASVRAQLYPFWELCIADDASPDPAIPALLQRESKRDKRVRWVRRPQNGHISAATNSALELAAGEFVALMDHDDLLPEHALYEVALAILACPDVDVIYSDEDRIDGEGRRECPYFKPFWSPELLAGHNMISHLGVYRRSLLEDIGGLRLGYEGSQDWDLALRATAATTPDRIRHIPAILYHWRWHTDAPSFSEAQREKCRNAGRRAVEDWLASEGLGDARVEPAIMVPDWNRVVHALPSPVPFVTVIVPTKDRPQLLATVVRGVLQQTAWPSDRLELLLVDNGSTDPDAVALLAGFDDHPCVRVLRVVEPFNYSKMNNAAASVAQGSILALLNNDIEVIDGQWLASMVSVALQPEVGLVGAKLLYPDGRVQHGGVVLGPDGHMAHVLRGASKDDPGYYGQLALRRSLSAVTGACMVLRKAVYIEAGGLPEELAVSYNDVDLCLRIGDLGYRVVWDPDAVLVHHESASRGVASTDAEHRAYEADWAVMRQRWGYLLEADRYHNPNLLLHEINGPMIPSPPRRSKPWLTVAPRG